MSDGAVERRDAGRRARKDVPRRALAEVAERTAADDPVARLLGQDRGRVPALVPLRYRRMSADPFAFLRGAPLLMTDDLVRGESTSLEVQIAGDAHGANFGVFSSPERRLVFDVNDFDETDTGPFEWDVKRLATSLVIAADLAGNGPAAQSALAEDVATAYQRSVAQFARSRRIEAWYATLDVESVLRDLRCYFTDSAARAVGDVLRRARSRDAKAFAEMVTAADGGPRIRLDPPHVTAIGATADASILTLEDLRAVLDGYRDSLSDDRRTLLEQFTFLDAAHLVRGVGSVGTQCFAVLLQGRDADDLLVLQVKEAQRTVLDLARGSLDEREPGERVVAGQRLMQVTPDDLLGWSSVRPRGARATDGPAKSFYVRQLYDQRASVDLGRLDATQLRAYGRACAWVLARAHSRSGLAAEIAGFVGRGRPFAAAIGEFASAYRERNLGDFRAFTAAIAEGRVPVGE
ncbi:MAG: DUF2252 domain-containing protein [Acidobacteriota bacterium]|nr:DUF2252 domain-containing protein [Acidobacteriota bacterium]